LHEPDEAGQVCAGFFSRQGFEIHDRCFVAHGRAV
jgi:hypothetical protein